MTTVTPNKIIAALLEVADIAHKVTWASDTSTVDQLRESLARLGTLPYEITADDHMTGPARARLALASFLEDAPKPNRSTVKLGDAVQTRVTVEDAIDAITAWNETTARPFLDRLAAMRKPCPINTDEEGYIIDGAMQNGFDTIDDDGDLFAVAGADLIGYMLKQRAATIAWCAKQNATAEYMPNMIYQTATNAKGEVVLRGAKTSSEAAAELMRTDHFTALEEAKRMRDMDFKPYKIGAVWVCTDNPPCVEDWMRKAVFKEMYERLALPDGDEAAIGPRETLGEMCDIAYDKPISPSGYNRNVIRSAAMWLAGRSNTHWAAKQGYGDKMNEYAKELQSIANQFDADPIRTSIAASIEYPAKWDTACYDTLESALTELHACYEGSKIFEDATADVLAPGVKIGDATAHLMASPANVAHLDKSIAQARAGEAKSRELLADAPQHDLYKDGDKDIPEQLVDSNGQVVLAQCKRCGRAEAELSEPCMPRADWAMCVMIADEALVDEALRGFIEDPTGDNAVCLVRDIVEEADRHRGAVLNLDSIPAELRSYRNASEQWVSKNGSHYSSGDECLADDIGYVRGWNAYRAEMLAMNVKS